MIISLLGAVLPAGRAISAGDLRWKVAAESGLYIDSGSQNAEERYQLTVLEADARYRGRYRQLSYALQFKVKPEFLGRGMADHALKYSGNGSFGTRFSKVDLTLDFSNRRQNFRYRDHHLDFNFFRMNVLASRPLHSRYRLLADFSYFYHDMQSQVTSSLDAVVFRALVSRVIWRRASAGIGGYFEKFSLGNSTYPGLELDNVLNLGWRNGLEFLLEYQRKIILRLNYRLLWHHSDLTGRPAPEHLFSVLFGKMFGRRFSVFFLGEYFSSKIRLDPDLEELYGYSALFYSSLHSVNRSHIKLAWRLGTRFEIHVKGGLVRGNYFFDDFSLSGLNVMTGISYSR